MQLRDEQGKIISLSALKGKRVFLNLWATWCPPCVAELPSIQSLYDKTGKLQDNVFLIVSLDDEFVTAKDFMKKKGYNFPIYEVVGNMPELFNVPGIPATFVFDKKGALNFSHIGMNDYSKRRFVQMMEP